MNIGEENMPKLVAQLLDTKFMPEHLRGGFRETKVGLYLLNVEAIPLWRIAPALLLTDNSEAARLTAETSLHTEL